jgi:hypothetical protein
MERNLMLLKIAVEQMTAKHKIPISFFECKYRKRKGKKIGVKVLIDAQYLEYIEALKKWRDRILEFCSVEFTIETFHVDMNRDRKISVMGIKKAPEFVSDAYCECGVRMIQDSLT